MQSKQRQIMVEVRFSTTHYHVKLLNIKLGTSCALKYLCFVTDQSMLIVMPLSEHSALKISKSSSSLSLAT